jgi:hypothetical protein
MNGLMIISRGSETLEIDVSKSTL